MKAQRNHSDRHQPFSFRRPPGSTLLHILTSYFDLLITMLLPVCMIMSCTRTGMPDNNPTDDVYVQADSCRFTLHLRVNDNSADTLRKIGKIDLFIYDADGLRELLARRTYGFLPDSVVLFCKARNISAVAIANSPKEFNNGALERYDSIELLAYSFEEDSPLSPVMSGQRDLEAGASGSLILSPLLSRIKTGEISNKMRGYKLLENPRIYLENMNSSAEVLRTAGFHPSETINAPQVVRLPYDIGIFTQNPGTELFCYPNDAETADIGSPATVFVFECDIEGQTCSFRVPLPRILRNSTTRVDISVSDAVNFDSKVY